MAGGDYTLRPGTGSLDVRFEFFHLLRLAIPDVSPIFFCQFFFGHEDPQVDSL
jgi:hypothetical protein